MVREMEKITEFTEEELAAAKDRLRRALIDAAIKHTEDLTADDVDDEDIDEARLELLDKILYKTFEGMPRDIDPSGTPLAPGNPSLCMGSGGREYFECCCDECPHFLKCFPEYEKQQKKLT